MPRYPYECPRCGVYREVFKSMSKAGREEKCPECKIPLRRIFTRPETNVKGGTPKFGGTFG